MKINLRELLAKKGYTVYKASKILGITQQTMSSWANGRTQPSYTSMDMLCGFLSCTMAELFTPDEYDIEPLEPYVAPDRRLGTRISKMYEYITEKGEATTDELSEALGIERGNVTYSCMRLIVEGLIKGEKLPAPLGWKYYVDDKAS